VHRNDSAVLAMPRVLFAPWLSIDSRVYDEWKSITRNPSLNPPSGMFYKYALACRHKRTSALFLSFSSLSLSYIYCSVQNLISQVFHESKSHEKKATLKSLPSKLIYNFRRGNNKISFHVTSDYVFFQSNHRV